MNLESNAEGQSRSMFGTLVREHCAGCPVECRLILYRLKEFTAAFLSLSWFTCDIDSKSRITLLSVELTEAGVK